MRLFRYLAGVLVILFLGMGTAAAQIKSLVPPEGTWGTTVAPEQQADHSTAAVGGDPTQCSFKYGTIHFSCIIPYAGYLLKVVIFMGGGLALFKIILSGYKIVMGRIFESKKEEGKQQLIRTMMGFAAIVLSYFLVDTVIQALT